MENFTWQDGYAVGVASIDAQHKRLFEISASLAEALALHRSQRAMKEIMRQLVAYTQEHFAFEEKILEQAGYPDLAKHRAQHRQLLRKVERFRHELFMEHRRVGPDVHRFLQGWLTHHILEHDLAYVPALEGAPVEP